MCIFIDGNEPELDYFLLSVVVEVAEEWFVSLSVLVHFFLFLGDFICDSMIFLVSFGFVYFNYCPKDVYFGFEWLLLIKPMDAVISTKFSLKSTDTQGVL